MQPNHRNEQLDALQQSSHDPKKLQSDPGATQFFSTGFVGLFVAGPLPVSQEKSEGGLSEYKHTLESIHSASKDTLEYTPGKP
jgi:hypothetical protein